MSSSKAKKTQEQKQRPAPATAQRPGATIAPQDAKLLRFVRDNAPQICAGMTLAAAREAELHNYPEMQALNTVATQLGTLTGQTGAQGQAAGQGQAPRAMGAAAGSGG